MAFVQTGRLGAFRVAMAFECRTSLPIGVQKWEEL